jgi:hypothetical protein
MTHSLVLLTRVSNHKVMLSPGKLDGLVWHSRLFNFPVLRPSYPAGCQCVRNGHLLRSSLHGQNPEYVLTIPGGSGLAVAPMVRTTPPKEDKEGTSSAEVPTAQALVARPKSKASHDNLADDNPDLLNFDVAESEIICQMSSRL